MTIPIAPKVSGGRRAFFTCSVFPTAFAVLVLSGCETKATHSIEVQVEPTAIAPAQALQPETAARVEITERGFEPPRVELAGAKQIVFHRATQHTCATAVAFPELGIEKALPLNVDVTIDIPDKTAGEFTFQCGMGMYKGKMMVR